MQTSGGCSAADAYFRIKIRSVASCWIQQKEESGENGPSLRRRLWKQSGRELPATCLRIRLGRVPRDIFDGCSLRSCRIVDPLPWDGLPIRLRNETRSLALALVFLA